MNQYTHQVHALDDPAFPISVSADQLRAGSQGFGMHWHDNLEILYICSGSANIMQNMCMSRLCIGQIAVINTDALHDVLGAEEDCEFYCVLIDRQFCALHGFDLKSVAFKPVVDDPHISECFLRLAAEMTEKTHLYKAAVMADILRILVLLGRDYAQTDPIDSVPLPGNIDLAKKAVQYVNAHIGGQIDIGRMGAELGVSKYYLCHLFKNATGMTIIEYYNHMRSRIARAMLQSGKYNVSECADALGFADTSYFSRLYRKCMGRSPRCEIASAQKEKPASAV